MGVVGHEDGDVASWCRLKGNAHYRLALDRLMNWSLVDLFSHITWGLTTIMCGRGTEQRNLHRPHISSRTFLSGAPPQREDPNFSKNFPPTLKKREFLS
jgi:hypothetical protein